MELKQKLISIIVSVIVFIVIIELVRRKKLMEEFSWIWLLAGVSIVAFSVWGSVFKVITRFTGIVTPTSIVFFFGIIFLILINLQVSIILSKSKENIKNMAQRISLYENELKSAKAEIDGLKKKTR